MAFSNEAGKQAGRKRKHDDAGEAQRASVKKSKSAAKSEGKRDRVKGEMARREDRSDDITLENPAVESISKKTIKRARRERKRRKAAAGTVVAKDDDTVQREHAIDRNSADEARAHGKQNKKTMEKAARRRNGEQSAAPIQLSRAPKAKWTLSDSSAGHFLDHDPIFVRDADGKDFVVAAIARDLQVMSMETSLFVRTLSAPEAATITGFASESAQSNLIHVSYSNGDISVWDWTSDFPARLLLSTTVTIKALSAVRLDDDDGNALMPYIAHADGWDCVCTQDGVVHRTRHPLESIQALGKAEYVVARGAQVVVIGARNTNNSYSIVELPLTKPSTCIDARLLPLPRNPKKETKGHHQLQLAIGNSNGEIHLYDDISCLLNQSSQERLPSPRILHWHRSAVSSVKFSPDGNYLISGGKETVLVLWQLETGKKQYLPHLTSEIERIVVSPHGDRYALQMGDNSIMVLSTAELKPVANFAGLQMQVAHDRNAPELAATLHPKHAKQLLLTVPATQPKSARELAPRPFLQTFDLGTARHGTRQALTRNNATDLNVGPEENPILPPDVARLAISQDGEWLATVDEWMPPASDVARLASSKDGIQAEQYNRREVYLKFWHWDASQELWTLSTRADAPHGTSDGQSIGAGRILALSSDPASNCFATVGEDSCVKFWKPKARIRNGTVIRDAQDVEQVEWTCRRAMHLTRNDGRADSPLDTVAALGHNREALAYSSDGSLLALSHTAHRTLDESAPTITLIDTAAGAIKSTTSGLSDGSTITYIAFLDRYFIVVSHKAAFVWDLVNNSMMHKVKLPHGSNVDPILAVNEADQTFAIATPAEQGGKQAQVAVYSTRHTGRLYKQEFDTGVVKILSEKGSRGFVLLFANATVRTIMPTGAAVKNAIPLSLPADSDAVPARVEADVEMELEPSEDDAESFGLLPRSAVKMGVDDEPAFEVDEDDRPVVRPEQLATIFDVWQSFAMPPVKDMFRAVVDLFARRPS